MDPRPDRWTDAIPVTRVLAEYEALDRVEGRPPDAADARGLLSEALLHIACVQQRPDCPSCPVSDLCVVPGWFDPNAFGGNRVRPFAVHVPEVGSRAPRAAGAFRMEWTFTGEVPRPSLLVEAFSRVALGGVGPRGRRVPHALRALGVVGHAGLVLVVRDGRQVADWPAAARLTDLLLPVPDADPWEVQLVSPLHDAELDPRAHDVPRPHPGLLLVAALNRVRRVASCLGVRVERRWVPDPMEVGGVWLDWSPGFGRRWSERRQAFVPLHGHRGRVVLDRSAADWMDLVAAAEVLHCGGETSYGLGRIRITRR